MPLFTRDYLKSVYQNAVDLYGNEIDQLLIAFSKKDNKNIERKDMPQIDDVDEFTTYLTTLGIPYIVRFENNPFWLNPTQKEVSAEKILGNLIRDEKSPGYWRNRTYIISKDRYLLDGHHDWVLCMRKKHVDQPHSFIKVVEVQLPIVHLLGIANNWDGSGYKKLHEAQASTNYVFQTGLVANDVVFKNNQPYIIKSVHGNTCILLNENHQSLTADALELRKQHTDDNHAVNNTRKFVFKTVKDAEKQLSNIIKDTKKIVFETGVIHYLNDNGVVVKLWPSIQKTGNYYADINKNKELNEVTQPLNESYVPDDILPKTIEKWIVNNGCFLKPMAWNPIEEELTATIYLPITTVKKISNSPGEKAKLTEEFKIRIKSIISDLGNTTSISYLLDSASIIEGYNEFKQDKIYGNIKKDTVYASVVIRLSIPIDDVNKLWNNVSSIIDKHPAYGVLMGKNDKEVFLYVPFLMPPQDIETLRTEISNQFGFRNKTEFLGWLNINGQSKLSANNAFINGSNLLYQSLIAYGFLVNAIGVYLPEQLNRSLKNVFTRSGYAYMKFKVDDIQNLSEGYKVARTLIDTSGFDINDFALFEEQKQMLAESDSYIQFLNEDLKENIKTVYNFLAGKGTKIKSFGRSLETAVVQQVVAEMDAKLRAQKTANKVEAKNILDIAERKIEAYANVIDHTKDKIDQIAGTDKRLQRIAARTKTEAALEGNKKKLDYLNKLDASDKAKDKIKERIQDEEEYLRNSPEPELPKEKKKGKQSQDDTDSSTEETSRSAPSVDNNQDEKNTDSNTEETSRSAPSVDDENGDSSSSNTKDDSSDNPEKKDETSNKSIDDKIADLKDKIKNEEHEGKKLWLNNQLHQLQAEKQTEAIKNLEQQLEDAKKRKDKDNVKDIESKLDKAKKKKAETDDKIQKITPDNVEKERQKLNDEIKDMQAYIDDQEQELRQVLEELKEPTNQQKGRELDRQKKELMLNILQTKMEGFELHEKYYSLLGNDEKEKSYKEKRELCYKEIQKIQKEKI